MFCSKCGQIMNEDAAFCPSCGTLVSAIAQPEKRKVSRTAYVVAVVMAIMIFFTVASVFVSADGEEINITKKLIELTVVIPLGLIILGAAEVIHWLITRRWISWSGPSGRFLRD